MMSVMSDNWSERGVSVIRQLSSFAWCGTAGNGNAPVGIALLLVGLTLGPGAVAAQGRLEARATVISVSAAREGLTLSDSVTRVGVTTDTSLTRRRVDGPLTSLFWYPAAVQLEGHPLSAPRPVRAGLVTSPHPRTARVARVLEIHYLRN